MTRAEQIQKLRKWKFSWRLLGENFVFRDGKSYYKMPTFLARNLMYRKNDSYEKVCDSMRIIQKYFWALTKIPKTIVHRDSDGHYVIEQKIICGEKLSKKTLKKSPELLSKFKRLVIANEIMWMKEWVFLDLLGSDYITHPQTIHNLLTDGKEIYVFDFWLLEKKSSSVFFRHFSHFAQRTQLWLVKRFFS